MKSRYSKIFNEHNLKLQKICKSREKNSGTSANDKYTVKISVLEAKNIAPEANIADMESKQGGKNTKSPKD